MRISTDESRGSLLAGLRARRSEIGHIVLARVQAIGEMGRYADPEYLDGLRHATATAIDHALDSIDRADDAPLPVPVSLVAQARLAARQRLPLETVLRRYLAGHAVVANFVVEEAARQGVAPVVIGPILRSLAARTDLTVATISTAYAQEQSVERPMSSDRRRTELISRLLDGELIDASAIDYDFDRWHLALVLRGEDTRNVLESLAGPIDARRLIAAGGDDSIWVWLCSRDKVEPRLVAEMIPLDSGGELRVGIGEPGKGRTGWRLSHEQARAALSVATRRLTTLARYADVALLASVMRDELLSTWLRRFYLEPLESERDGGAALLETLRAFFGTGKNVSSAGAVLGVTRHTVTKRLRRVEERIGQPLIMCGAQLEIALGLVDLEEQREIDLQVLPSH